MLSHRTEGEYLDLPMQSFTDSFKQKPKKNKLQIQYGSERVLMVDDEPDIIEVQQQILRKLGYKVTSYTDSVRALEVFRKHPFAYDLVITDMAMPVMQGEKLCEEIFKIRTDIPILVCTGFNRTLSDDKATSIGIKGFISKPVIMKDFSTKIREILS